MTKICVEEQALAKQIVQDIEQDKIAKAVKRLYQQAANSSELPPTWLLKTVVSILH